ncbi:helix-turn-helix domain-containing protein [Planosporangium thailandense]|uniref:Helix-turn-helix domain-containing protein n=1 Tax=Planosporangium thailandense TaxID=765197 RepID=A0ABX0XXD7_9ACTN|nr:helix-turn-helix domain-containing protein [Planosporangium thailandense]
MARQERPIDPTAGPLPRFAQELRKLRVEAGNPTYRALAKAAGYSATTLSEAAGGTRKPSLDVVLAFVGACGGDPDLWRERWIELDAALRPEPVTPAGPPEHADGAVPPEPAEHAGRAVPPEPAAPSPDRAGRRWPGRVVALVAALGALAALAIAVVIHAVTSRARTATPTAAPAPGCPEVRRSARFIGTTYASGTRIRNGAALDAPVLSTVPPGCAVGFTGFCIGEKANDPTAGIPDVRWFTVDGGGVIASAVVHGNPPADLRLSHCPRERPAPDAVSLTGAPDPGEPGSLRLQATGRHVDLVGFAAYYAADSDQPERREWHQVGLAVTGAPAFEAAWRPGPLRAVLHPGEQVALAAVACLGGEGPTKAMDVKVTTGGGSGELTPSTQPPPQLDAAGRAACRYPNR